MSAFRRDRGAWVIALLKFHILCLSLIPLVPSTIWRNIDGTAFAMTIPAAIVAMSTLHRSAKALGAKTNDFYVRGRRPVIATETTGAIVFALQLALLELLPPRVPFPFSSHGVSEVTIMLIVGIVVGIPVYFVLLRWVDRRLSLVLRGRSGWYWVSVSNRENSIRLPLRLRRKGKMASCGRDYWDTDVVHGYPLRLGGAPAIASPGRARVDRLILASPCTLVT